MRSAAAARTHAAALGGQLPALVPRIALSSRVRPAMPKEEPPHPPPPEPPPSSRVQLHVLVWGHGGVGAACMHGVGGWDAGGVA